MAIPIILVLGLPIAAGIGLKAAGGLAGAIGKRSWLDEVGENILPLAIIGAVIFLLFIILKGRGIVK